MHIPSSSASGDAHAIIDLLPEYPERRRRLQPARVSHAAGSLVRRYHLALPVLAALAVGAGAAGPLVAQSKPKPRPKAPAPAAAVTEVQVTPETMTLGVGQKQPLFATAFDKRGNLLPNVKFTFISVDPAIAKVAADGQVTGLKPGLTKVEAHAAGRRAAIAVLVNPDSAADSTRGHNAVLTIDPAAIRLLPGEGLQLRPQLVRDDGTGLAVGKVQWKTLKPDIAQVDSTGTVIGVAAGQTIVQAAASGLEATAPVTVEQADVALAPAKLVVGPGESDTLHVTVPSQGNRELHADILWRSTDSSIARVADGVVQGVAPGDAEIVLTAFGAERRAAVHVHKAATILVVSPRPADGPILVPMHGFRPLAAHALAADSTPVAEARVAGEVGDTAVASYDAGSGTVAGHQLGTTTLTARLPGFDPVAWTIRVIPGEVAFDRSRVGLVVGERATLAPRLLDEAGKPLAGTPEVKWKTSNATVAGLGGDGAIEAKAPGHATVTATAPWGKTATADVFVTGDLLVSSSRRGGIGIFQLRTAAPDSFLLVRADNGQSIQPVFSPDRTRIAFAASSAPAGAAGAAATFDIYVMDADGGNVRQLTHNPGSETEPVWTPDGKRIIYTGTSNGTTQLFIMSADGGESRPLTVSPGGNGSAAVAPDGHRIAFTSARDGNYELYLTDVDGGQPMRLTRTSQREANPQFLPDGSIVYTVDRGGGSRVMSLAAGAAQPVMLFESEQPITGLAVSRDGHTVAYTTGKLTGNRDKARFGLFLRALPAPGTPPPPATAVPIAPGEQVLSPSF
jgi:uncharacterized protein YjdB